MRLINIILLSGLFSPCLHSAKIHQWQGKIELGRWELSDLGNNKGEFLKPDFQNHTDLALKVELKTKLAYINIQIECEPYFRTDHKPKRIKIDRIIDNASEIDLNHEEGIIVINLFNVPEFLISRYLIEVTDHLGNKVVAQPIESPTGPPNQFGIAVSKLAEYLWTVLEWVYQERSNEFVNYSYKSLVIANPNDTEEHVIWPNVKGFIRTPIWINDEKILFVEEYHNKTTLKVIHLDDPEVVQNFGNKIEGLEPHNSPRGNLVIFRKETNIFSVNIDGTNLKPLITNKNLSHILGIIPEIGDDRIFKVVFVTRREDTNFEDICLGTVEGNQIKSIERLPFNTNWYKLFGIKIKNNMHLYSKRNDDESKKRTWSIYLSQNPLEEGERISKGTSNNVHPSWNRDGNKIVFVSDRPKLKEKTTQRDLYIRR